MVILFVGLDHVERRTLADFCVVCCKNSPHAGRKTQVRQHFHQARDDFVEQARKFITAGRTRLLKGAVPARRRR